MSRRRLAGWALVVAEVAFVLIWVHPAGATPTPDLGGSSYDAHVGAIGHAHAAASLRGVRALLPAADEATAVVRAGDKASDVIGASRWGDEAADVGRQGDQVRSVCPTSFAPETMVYMGDGSVQAIHAITVGDWVWASDPVTGEAGPRVVLNTIVGEGPKDLVVLTIDGATVTATAGHPFWVEGPDVWMDAGDLQVGHQVLSIDGGLLTIEAIVEHQAVARVHNLEVEGLHTYYVQFGDEDVLVHNVGGGCLNPKVSDQIKNHILDGDGPGSRGHRWPGQPGKTPFPKHWTDDQVIDAVKDVARKPTISRIDDDRSVLHWGAREGVDIRVRLRGDNVVQAFPINNPRAPW